MNKKNYHLAIGWCHLFRYRFLPGLPKCPDVISLAIRYAGQLRVDGPRCGSFNDRVPDPIDTLAMAFAADRTRTIFFCLSFSDD